MKFQKIGSRGMLFPFKDPFPTNVYVIIGPERIYMLDTFLGSESMAVVKKTLDSEGHGDKPVVVFNSHGDYDHYWGNAAFEGALIIGHEECRARILKESDESLLVNREQKKGEVIVKAPSLVFAEKIRFPDDGLTFYHTPGHTTDSASCYDEVDKVLFVGDNVESPLPYIYNTDIAQFHDTLKSYFEIDWDLMIASHASPLHDRSLLERNIEYLSKLRSWHLDITQLSQEELHLHSQNISYLQEVLSESELTPEIRKHFEEIQNLKLH
ncbi:MAG: MBL fold metallo-hydrolase [Candidatus Thorarchaeota archaeon]